MRKKIAADKKTERTVGKDNVFSKLKTMLVGIAENGFLRERIIDEIRVTRNRYEGERRNKAKEQNCEPAFWRKRSAIKIRRSALRV